MKENLFFFINLKPLVYTAFDNNITTMIIQTTVEIHQNVNK